MQLGHWLTELGFLFRCIFAVGVKCKNDTTDDKA